MRRLNVSWVAAGLVVSVTMSMPSGGVAAEAPRPASGMVRGNSLGQHEDAAAISAEAQEAIKLIDAHDSYLRQKGFIQLEMLREPATAVLVRRYLESRDPQTRAWGARALAAIDGAKAVPTLVERLTRDKSPRVRVAAILALEPLKDPSATTALMARLRDRNPEVRMAAADAVSRLNDPDARDAVRLRWRRERNRDVRRVLEDAMKRIGSS
ncbi:MAG: HEAT repeat domain-containing protein [Candidatus Omnitrophica bacterium]|nr:HEAT repeat domain-containing protein [Candidatus Omnitrophota bacterium]